MIPGAPNIGRLWADLMVEELLRSGVGLFCIAPGSRSTPLVTAIAANEEARDRVLLHFDERGTAFAALGYARATGRPAAWVTTSGTAVANGLPAVVEASTDAVPLLLLTADRPPELRQTGANQTIDQPGIFGGYTRWRFDLPAPDPQIDPAMVLTTVDQAVHRARRPPAGPVHLNLMFREPLAPESDGGDYREYLSGLAPWLAGNEPYTRYAAARPAVDPAEVEALWEELHPVQKGLLIAGHLQSPQEAGAVLRLARTLGWPLLPDVTSHLRLGLADRGSAAPYYDLLLAGEEFRREHRPEAVLHVGGRLVSKRLQQLVADARPAPYALVRPDPSRLDPDHRVTRSIESDVPAFCDALAEAAERSPGSEDASWLSGWREASEAAERSLERLLPETGPPGEPHVARMVSRHIPEGTGLLLASSMPVRDVDGYGAPGGPQVFVASNRGASGIDGTVATAAGMVRGLGRPVTLILGDLALLYDLNSLAMLRNLPAPVVVVAVNNDGGGIFSFLPIARHRDVFETYFGTPHGLSFDSAAKMFGLHYAQPASGEELLEAYRAAHRRSGPTLIEVQTDREENLALHRELQETVAAEVRDRTG